MQKLLAGEVSSQLEFKKDPKPRGDPFFEERKPFYHKTFGNFLFNLGDKVTLRDDKEAGTFRVLDRWILNETYMYLIMPMSDNFNGRLRTAEINLVSA